MRCGKAISRKQKDQKPEQFRKVAFRGGVESRSLGQDENRFLVDSGTDQVILVVVDPKGSWKSNGNIRVEVLDAGASIDRLQPNRKGQNASDNEEVKKRSTWPWIDWFPAAPQLRGQDLVKPRLRLRQLADRMSKYL